MDQQCMAVQIRYPWGVHKGTSRDAPGGYTRGPLEMPQGVTQGDL